MLEMGLQMAVDLHAALTFWLSFLLTLLPCCVES